MPLTGKDVQEAVFTTSRKGYSKDEVDDFLDRVVESLEEYRGRLTQLEAQLGITPTPSQPGDQTSGFAAPTAGAAVTGAAVAGAPVATTAPAEPGGVKPPASLATAATVSPPAAAHTPAAPASVSAPETGATETGHQAGWYPDPWQQASERYYDGKEWTAQTR